MAKNATTPAAAVDQLHTQQQRVRLSAGLIPSRSVSVVVLDPNLGAGVMAMLGKLEWVEEHCDVP